MKDKKILLCAYEPTRPDFEESTCDRCGKKIVHDKNIKQKIDEKICPQCFMKMKEKEISKIDLTEEAKVAARKLLETKRFFGAS